MPLEHDSISISNTNTKSFKKVKGWRNNLKYQCLYQITQGLICLLSKSKFQGNGRAKIYEFKKKNEMVKKFSPELPNPQRNMKRNDFK